MVEMPVMTEFRTECARDNVVHLVFDSPNRPMNVFSNKAIHDLGLFADWLPGSESAGVVIRSGKTSAFCAGADLNELGVAYDMIMAAPREARSRVAFDHFFRLSLALRKLETAGKPVAAAIAGLALGGGGELALAAHHRVMVDNDRTAFGLPESLVGLLPGGGGTQRLPRIVGLKAALPILLDGGRLAGQAAVDAGVVDQLVVAGEEVAAAERWVLSNASASQLWDRAGWRSPDAQDLSNIVAARRFDTLATTQGHYPAPLAILECVERGLPQAFDTAICTEMEIFSQLIQRREPRNMIRTLFLGRLDHDRLRKIGGISPDMERAVALVAASLTSHHDDVELTTASMRAGFGGSLLQSSSAFDGVIAGEAFWHEAEPVTEGKRKLQACLAKLDAIAADWRPRLPDDQRRAADYMLVKDHGFPSYLGGVFALGLS